MENQLLLGRITRVQSTVNKDKIDHDWDRIQHYRQLIQKSAKRSDLSTMAEKRQDFVRKNFQVLPRVYRHSLDMAGIHTLSSLGPFQHNTQAGDKKAEATGSKKGLNLTKLSTTQLTGEELADTARSQSEVKIAKNLRYSMQPDYSMLSI